MKKTNSFLKKDLGTWGECSLDSWMENIGFSIFKKNMFFRGGEIDRIYLRDHHHQSEFCIAEVKTKMVFRNRDIDFFSTEIGYKSILKSRQVQNLYRIAENISSSLSAQNKKFKIYVRIFLVLKFYSHNMYLYEKKSKELCQKRFGLNVCVLDQQKLIYSFTPEITPFCMQKSLSQVYCRS